MKHRWFTIGLLLGFLIAGCAGGISPGPPGGSQIDSLDDLAEALREEGAEVERAGTISQPFFSGGAEVLQVDGEEIQVFQFPNQEARVEQAELVAADGSSIGTTMATWIATPHFFEAGRLIVLYVGEDEGVLQLLESNLGLQFAGG